MQPRWGAAPGDLARPACLWQANRANAIGRLAPFTHSSCTAKGRPAPHLTELRSVWPGAARKWHCTLATAPDPDPPRPRDARGGDRGHGHQHVLLRAAGPHHKVAPLRGASLHVIGGKLEIAAIRTVFTVPLRRTSRHSSDRRGPMRFARSHSTPHKSSKNLTNDCFISEMAPWKPQRRPSISNREWSPTS